MDKRDDGLYVTMLGEKSVPCLALLHCCHVLNCQLTEYDYKVYNNYLIDKY